MEAIRKILDILDKPTIRHTQAALNDLAAGLAWSWLVLGILELIRPGIASIYLDLNLILVLALSAWVVSVVKPLSN